MMSVPHRLSQQTNLPGVQKRKRNNCELMLSELIHMQIKIHLRVNFAFWAVSLLQKTVVVRWILF